jgi:hypothetical protein
MIEFAKAEMAKIGIIEAADVLDACVIRVPKTYPAYFGAYERFDEIKITSASSIICFWWGATACTSTTTRTTRC